MASLVMQLDDQLEADGAACLFGAFGGFGAGEQRRDFVYVNDVIDIALWFFSQPEKSGIFNCCSGQSRMDLTLLRGAGYAGEFTSIDKGIRDNLAWRRQTGEVHGTPR